MMKQHVQKYLEVHLEGMLFSLLINTKERLQLWANNATDFRPEMYHENTILQVFLDRMLFTNEKNFFESITNLAIHEFIIRNVSCHKFNIRTPLKMMSANMLSQNDYSERRSRA